MKISERFTLGANQFELDFVDVDTETDLPLFIDPFFLGIRTDNWSISATRTLKSFFQTFVSLIGLGKEQEARQLFNFLHEPNETCLGLSEGAPRGNAIGEVDGEKLFKSIIKSRAVQSGLVEDIEDFRLFIEGIDKDKISDMTTNIIRSHLIEYTQRQCALWGIALQSNVASGDCWDSVRGCWVSYFTDMLVIDGRKILLTPKSAVSYAKRYTPQKYHSKFVLEFLQHEHVRMNSGLVQYRRDGSPYVTKKDLRKKVAPYSKDFLADFTQKHPHVFADFKEWIAKSAEAIKNEEIVDDDAADIAQYLIDKLLAIPPGGKDATRYHRTVVGILEFLLYPSVTSPILEQEIHDGRKRVDIVFDNAASAGFFYRLHTTYDTPAQFIFVECKNYSTDISNPGLDQLAGRFSTNRGKFGLMLCRSAEDLTTLIKRCNDAYSDSRGILVPIIDDDLVQMLHGVIAGVSEPYEKFFTERFRAIAMGSPIK